MEKRKVTAKQWEEAVRKARQYTHNYGRVRWIVADLALEVCDISKGGRKTESVYSVRRFADEIEIEPKTLYQWIRVKRLVYDKLPKGIQDKAHKHLYSDFEAVSDKVTFGSSPADVKRRWIEQMGLPPEARKFEKYTKHLDSILYNLKRPMVMMGVERRHIEIIIEKATLMLALSRQEIEFREKYPSDKQRNVERLNVKGELKKRIGIAE